MKKELTITYEEFDSVNDLNNYDSSLLDFAIEASKKSYSPYSGFKVGSALILNNGQVYIGCNQENMAFSPTICGERVAMFNASSDSDSPIQTIAIYCSSDRYTVTEPGAPCGVCRQVMSEFEMRYNQKIRVILKGETGKILIFNGVENLLPFAFSGLKI